MLHWKQLKNKSILGNCFWQKFKKILPINYLFGYLIHSYITYIVLRTLIIIVRVFLLLCSWNCKERYDYYYCYVHKLTTLKVVYTVTIWKRRKNWDLYITQLSLYYILCVLPTQKNKPVFLCFGSKNSRKFCQIHWYHYYYYLYHNYPRVERKKEKLITL